MTGDEEVKKGCQLMMCQQMTRYLLLTEIVVDNMSRGYNSFTSKNPSYQKDGFITNRMLYAILSMTYKI